MDIHSDCNEQYKHRYRRLLKSSANIFFLVSDGFCAIIGHCRINEEVACFPAAANLSPYKLVIVSI